MAATGGGKAALVLGRLLLLLCVLGHGAAQRYNAIWSFGDSISDTGNLCVGGGCPSWLTTGQPPYGETFFGRPTGRCSDGRVIVDFLGMWLCAHTDTGRTQEGWKRRTGCWTGLTRWYTNTVPYVCMDYAAEHFGLPLLPASKAGGDLKKGANMAIIGATTMDFDFFKSIGLSDKIWNNGPLDTQIQWFRQLLPSVCGKGTCTSMHA